jgi:hypothetical protein
MKKKKIKGFILAELLIGLGILGVLSSGIYIFYNSVIVPKVITYQMDICTHIDNIDYEGHYFIIKDFNIIAKDNKYKEIITQYLNKHTELKHKLTN